MSKNLTLFFADNEEEIYNWLKKEHGNNTSKYVKDIITEQRKNNKKTADKSDKDVVPLIKYNQLLRTMCLYLYEQLFKAHFVVNSENKASFKYNAYESHNIYDSLNTLESFPKYIRDPVKIYLTEQINGLDRIRDNAGYTVFLNLLKDVEKIKSEQTENSQHDEATAAL